MGALNFGIICPCTAPFFYPACVRLKFCLMVHNIEPNSHQLRIVHTLMMIKFETGQSKTQMIQRRNDPGITSIIDESRGRSSCLEFEPKRFGRLDGKSRSFNCFSYVYRTSPWLFGCTLRFRLCQCLSDGDRYVWSLDWMHSWMSLRPCLNLLASNILIKYIIDLWMRIMFYIVSVSNALSNSGHSFNHVRNENCIFCASNRFLYPGWRTRRSRPLWQKDPFSCAGLYRLFYCIGTAFYRMCNVCGSKLNYTWNYIMHIIKEGFLYAFFLYV